jgi:rare lipoprotein A
MTWLLLLAMALTGCASSSPSVSSPGELEEGIASYYAQKFHGRPTASGETYDETLMTAAHPSLPFGTHVHVTNLETGNTVTVRVNDRGPFVEGRIIDLSRKAAERLDFLRAGTTRVRLHLADD